MASDDSLWARVQVGDAAAFGDLFDRHSKAIYNFCFRRTGEWSTAEDLTSIVFLEAWRLRKKDIQPGMVRAWLFGIALSVVRRQWRTRRRYQAALGRLPLPLPEPSFADGVEARVDAEREMRNVLSMIRLLPRREQEVIALCLWSELSYKETADVLNVPIGTVRSRVARARARLLEHEQRVPRAVGEPVMSERSYEQ